MLEQEKRKAFLADALSTDPAAQAARAQRWEEGRRSREFMAAHYHELFRQYPDQWVGVYLEEVVAVAPTHREALEQGEAKGISRSILRVSFMGKIGTPRRTPLRIERRA